MAVSTLPIESFVSGARLARLDTLTQKESAFRSFADLVLAPAPYRPTILAWSADRWELAEGYDYVQGLRGDERRAFRGNPLGPQVGDGVRFYSQNAWRHGRIERVGPVWVHASYVTKRDAAAAKRSGNPTPHRTRSRMKASWLVRTTWSEWKVQTLGGLRAMQESR